MFLDQCASISLQILFHEIWNCGGERVPEIAEYQNCDRGSGEALKNWKNIMLR